MDSIYRVVSECKRGEGGEVDRVAGGGCRVADADALMKELYNASTRLV